MQKWANFFHDIQQEAADLASVVAALQSGDRNDSKLLMIDIQKKKIFLAI
ncbi:conjugal transfer protein TraC [Orientia tsutsugamushi]|uniref:Conjugal transfer protein TraC n=1 Tax=Orientia tsutsugamushi TaxID=784 RepID=A0A2U3R7E7_ORITS|nr:conjugal transfer protein TraC [Orientia tsutsugamushi]